MERKEERRERENKITGKANNGSQSERQDVKGKRKLSSNVHSNKEVG